MNKITLIALVVVAAVAVGAYFFPRAVHSVFGASSPVGTTFNTAKVAEINFSPATGSATSTSILNVDASDRIVTNSFATCAGLGTSFTAYTGTALGALIFQAATTSTAAPTTLPSTNYVFNAVIATTTPTDAYVASSSYASVTYQRWPAGTYMTWTSNATNTAACSVGVNYIAT